MEKFQDCYGILGLVAALPRCQTYFKSPLLSWINNSVIKKLVANLIQNHAFYDGIHYAQALEPQDLIYENFWETMSY